MIKKITKEFRMITLKTDWALYVNIFVGILLIASIVEAYRKGLLRTLINLVRHILSLVVALLFARPLANVFPLINFKTSGIVEVISDALAVEGSVLIWFIIIFFGVLLVTLIFDRLFEFLEEIPIIGWINKVVGSVVGLVIGWIKLIVVCMLLVTPLFKNGQELIDASYLSAVQNTGEFIEPLKNNELYRKLSNNEAIDKEETETLEDILTRYNLNEEQLTEFLEGLTR